ncbi:hypothetical protein [Panacagrimonas sp.]|uniref:hypothetical protein n=1 Tax=Panacagrimonas sp. TaxID=2480088 RepID=UPI003B51E644
MSYEYNPESSRFNLPNPHRIENAVLGTLAAVLVIGGISSLYAAKTALAAKDTATTLLALLLGLSLLGYGVWAVARILRQFTFWFGRDQPGGFRDDQDLRQTIRQNAIAFPTPTSASDQLLYRMVPNLVFSPRPVQFRARQQFNNMLVLAGIGLCYLVATVGGVAVNISGWVNLLFFVLISAFILLPIAERGRKLVFTPLHLIVLLALSILGPTALGLLGANLPAAPTVLNFAVLNAVALSLALLINGMIIAALLSMVMVPERINSANSLTRASMNAHPRQLVVEFYRIMQEHWVERIPNREIVREEPVVDADAGKFRADVVEETQPVPRDSGLLRFADALRLREYRFLTLLDLLALGIGSAGAIYLAVNAHRDGPMSYTGLLVSIQMVVISLYAFSISNFLWRRFEFSSRAYWLEIDGNYQKSQVDYGRTLEDTIKTTKHVINIEDMTVRLWVADLFSVCFDVNDPRDLISMAGVPDEAERIGNLLVEFAADQRIFVAPTSNRDAAALNQMGALNRASVSGAALTRSNDDTRAAAVLEQNAQGQERPEEPKAPG